MTPLGRTKILAALSLGTAAVLAPAAYVGFEATIGGVWSHRAGISVRDRCTWWLPGHTHVCVYETPQGRTILRPVPSLK